MKLSLLTMRRWTFFALGFGVSALAAHGQTMIDLRTQSKSVDFSGASTTKPIKTGSVLPASCGTGELFFLLGAPAGTNTYGCTAPNTWTLQSGGASLPSGSTHANQVLTTDGATFNWQPFTGDVTGAPQRLQVGGLQGRPVAGTQPADGQVLTWNQTGSQWQPQTVFGSSGVGGAASGMLGVSYTSSSTLTLGMGCSSATPCSVRFGNTVYTVTSSSTAVLQSGVGRAYIYMTGSGTLSVGSNLPITCSPGCSSVANVSGFPPNSVPLYMWTSIPTGWDPNGGTDVRSYLSTKLVSTGLGLIAVDSGFQTTVSVDAAVIPTYLTGTSSLSFGTVAAGSCTSELSISVPGASAGDSVAPGWPPSIPASLTGMMRVQSGDAVRVKLCNPGAATIVVPADVFRATVIRSL